MSVYKSVALEVLKNFPLSLESQSSSQDQEISWGPRMIHIPLASVGLLSLIPSSEQNILWHSVGSFRPMRTLRVT
jgi:hypothetical protein